MERKRKEIITAVVRYAWYLGVCGYCSEAWILFCVVVVSYVGEFVSVGGREGGFFFYGRWVFMGLSKIVLGNKV